MPNIITENLFAVSMTADTENLPERVDLPMLYRPFRTLFLCGIMPSFAWPLAILHGWALLRCFYTGSRPKHLNIDKYEQKHTPEFIVYKRVFDHTKKKVLETHVSQEPEALKEALAVVGPIRDEYIDDGKGNSFWVMERKLFNKNYLFRREKWSWAVLSDIFRYAIPCSLCWMFIPASKRLHIDLLAWWKGALPLINIRHPIPNFFLSLNDYNRARYRIQARQKLSMPVSTKPWTPIE